MRGEIRMSKLAPASLVLLAVSALFAQTAANNSTLQANGSATLSAAPDQVQLTAAVVTQAGTAQNAAQQNALQTNVVIAAIQQVLGSSGTVQTVAYSVTPQYNNASPPVIAGYTASNTLQVTIYQLTSLPGQVIDAASQSGATNISGLTFSLQNPDPLLQQALTAAAKQALAHAGAIAAGLGVKAGAVVSAQEGGAVLPVVMSGVAAGVSATPILTGTVSVTGSVTITVQVTQ
jgi:uncharacterized protein YggE